MRRFLVVTVAALCLNAVSAQAQQSSGVAASCPEGPVLLLTGSARSNTAITTPRLCSVPNFRDVAGIAPAFGGTGNPDITSDGHFLQPGQFYRANALTLSQADLATISKLGIAEDIDLRTPYELVKPNGFDVVPAKAAYINVNIYGQQSFAKLNVKNAADADKVMLSFYTDFVANPQEREAFRMALTDMAYADGPVLFHCSAGKDRSGWLAAILQSIAGVPEHTIMQDYLASNLYRNVNPRVKPGATAGLAEMNTVQPEYLQVGFDVAKRQYGSMDNYISQGIGLSPRDIIALRARLIGKKAPG